MSDIKPSSCPRLTLLLQAFCYSVVDISWDMLNLLQKIEIDGVEVLHPSMHASGYVRCCKNIDVIVNTEWDEYHALDLICASGWPGRISGLIHNMHPIMWMYIGENCM